MAHGPELIQPKSIRLLFFRLFSPDLPEAENDNQQSLKSSWVRITWWEESTFRVRLTCSGHVLYIDTETYTD